MEAVTIVAYALALCVVYALLRRAHALAWACFAALPLLLTPLWARQDHATFMWFKVYSVQVGAAWVLALRRTALRERAWARATLCGVLAVNILEAVVYDGLHGRYVNALAGVALVAAIPSPRRVRVLPDGDLSLPLDRAWVLGYTIWNLAFLFMAFPAYAAIQASIMLPPLALGLWSPERWMQVRSYTFASHMLLAFSRWDLFSPYERPLWPAASVGAWMQLAAAATCAAALATARGALRNRGASSVAVVR